MNETRELARFVAETPFERIPTPVIEHVRLSVLDSFASGFAGALKPWTGMVAAMATDGTQGHCSLFGRDLTTSPSSAVLINGTAVGGFETDAPFSAGNCHPSGAVFPAVLSAAETRRLNGREFLTAVAVGYEALCRVGAAATRAVEDVRGFHGPGTNAPIGAAFGAGRAFGLDPISLTNAVGIAASHGGGLLEFHVDGAMTKRLHLGRGSQMGLESVLLAGRGFTGPSTAIEGHHGFLNVYSPSPRPELLLDGLGERWLLTGMAFKAHPCHLSFHAVVDAIVRFKRDHAIDARSIDAVEVRSRQRMMEHRFAERAPATLMGAQYSLPWSTAHALLKDASAPATWTEEALRDPDVNHLAATMTLTEAEPETPGAVAEIILTLRGKRHVIPATDWKGAPGNPASFADIAGKLTRYADSVIPAPRAVELAERIAALENEADVSAVIRLIRA